MPDTGWVNPTDSAQYDYGGGQPWDSIINGYTQNDTHDSADCYSLDQTDRITYFDFDFSVIPEGSSIDGIEFRYDGFDETRLWHFTEWQFMVHIGGTVRGDNKAVGAETVHASDQDTYHSFGGSTDDWGASLLWADVQNSDFGISMIFYNNDILDYLRMYVDHVQLKIHYTPNNPPALKNTGWVSPGTVTEYGSGNAWANEVNAKLQNDTYVDVNSLKGENTKNLAAENFSFGLPTDAIIIGIEVRYDVYGNNAPLEVREYVIQLHKSGTGAGDNKASGSIPLTDTDTYRERGDGWNDLWSSGYDYSDIVDSGFGFLYAVNNISTIANVFTYVDHMQIRITYTSAYDHDVNDVIPADIARINDCTSKSIETVNDT